MNLHIFNPEHDIALAYDKPRFSVPHAAQELRMNLGYLPAFWAEPGDYVLVDDISFALKAASQYRSLMSDVLFVCKDDLKHLQIDKVLPWGWDKRIAAELKDNGVDEVLLMTEDNLATVRTLSGRELTSRILGNIRMGREKETCGVAEDCKSVDEVETLLTAHKNIVVKAPWSSSGRGVRYVSLSLDASKSSWIAKTIERQGYVMVEPYYNKVCDFAMEFIATNDGNVKAQGLSVFHTLKAQYTGNVVASEEEKRMRLSRYVDLDLLDDIVASYEAYLPTLIDGKYVGAFGIDMMAVADKDSGKLLLHPCVELNLRRTMGHVALALSKKEMPFASMMSIVHKSNYQFCIERIEGKFVNVIYR